MRRKIIFSLSVVSFLWYGCGMFEESKDESSSADTLDATLNSDEVLSSNPMSITSPGALSLSFAPNDAGSSLTASKKSKTILQKARDLDKILKGTADSCKPPSFLEDEEAKEEEPEKITCYEFDQEMIYGTNPGGQTYGTRDGTASDKSDEACLVAFARSRVKRIEDRIDRAVGKSQGLVCQTKKDQPQLPTKGAGAKNFIDSMKKVFGDKDTVSKAEISRLEDIDGSPVYRTDIIVKRNCDTSGQNCETDEMHLVHSPKSDTDNSTYSGVLWGKITGFKDPHDARR